MKNLLTGYSQALIKIAALIWMGCACQAIDLASVSINDPGEWKPFAVGQRIASAETTTGPSSYWRNTPGILASNGLEFYYVTRDPARTQAEDYGQLNFTVPASGTVWILANTRGNVATLQSQGWEIILTGIQTEEGYDTFGKNQSILNWVLLERQCLAGQSFTLRTETYQAPVVLRTSGPRLQASRYHGGVIFEVVGNPGRYQLQSSSDLKNWTDEWPVVIRSNEPHLLTGTSFTPEAKFYRMTQRNE